ncbi:MAG: putative Ig domain-containing protein [Bacteroidota bacterium]|nr:putative Ig domain-containing protein [Bacteroidota bacterium]
MAIRATLLAAALCVSLVVAQPPSFMQMADGSHGVVDRAVLGDGYTQVVGYPGPQSAAIDQSVVHSYGTIRRDRDGAPVAAWRSAGDAQRMAHAAAPLAVRRGQPQGRDPARAGLRLRNAALAALYNATGGDSWDNRTNWDPMASPTLEELGTWHGVTVHMDRIIELQLDNNNLRGMLPPEIGDLADLQVLWIDGNVLEGSIPKEMGQLLQLRTLLMSHNTVSGPIPDQLGSLKELETLWLHDNGLSGEIPTALSGLTALRSLVISGNGLMGGIPDELGTLGQLETLWLNDNAISGEVPESIGDLEALQQLVLDNNQLSGSLPRSLLQLRNLVYLSFEGQPLCAPSDAAFQSWLGGISVVKGATCSEELHLVSSIADQSFTVNLTIDPVTFPAAMGGTAPYAYALGPAPPAGLLFDPASRLLTGTPTAISDPVGYTYTVSDHAGSQVSQTFSIEVMGSLSSDDEAVDTESFRVQGNYPNPFRETTRVVVDLPAPAVVTIQVMDLIGRHVLAVPATHMPAGRGQRIELTGSSLTSGLYLYRVQFSSREHTEVQFGQLLRIQ